MNSQNYIEKPTNTTGSGVKDLTFRIEALDDGIAPMRRLIETKIQRIQRKAPGYEYAQRELEALIPALQSIIAFRDDIVSIYNALASEHLHLRAENKVLRKRDDERWNRNFRDAFNLAKAIGAKLDEVHFSTIEKDAV